MMPTLAAAPSHWAPPVFLAGPAAAVFILTTGLLGCSLSWCWASDSFAASVIINRLLTSDRGLQRAPLPESIRPPVGGWIVSTAAHLTHWAIFLGRFAGDDKQSPGATAALLERALAISPINAQARLAIAQGEASDNTKSLSIHAVGLSRDAVSLAWSARQLLAAGKKDDALKLYGRAILLAIPDKSIRSRVPRFSDDPGIARYLLPGEEHVRDIVAELVSQKNVWTYDEWSRVLPESPIVLIATARLLREQGENEAEKVLGRILKESNLPQGSAGADPITFAVLAEALAFRSRYKEADQLYRQAIDLIADPMIQRSWWFNLADIAYRSDDEIQRQAALRSAGAVGFSDDITRRAADIQHATLARSTGMRAN